MKLKLILSILFGKEQVIALIWNKDKTAEGWFRFIPKPTPFQEYMIKGFSKLIDDYKGET